MRIFAMLMAVLSLTVSPKVWGQAEPDSPESRFYRANIEYEAGDNNAAIREAQSIISSGLESGNLYYNLGNMYFKNGEIGKAILSYERARRFIPRDRDLLANYRYVRSQMKRPDPLEKRWWLYAQLDRYFGYLTPAQGVWLIMAIYYLISGWVVISGIFGFYRRYFIYVLAGAGLVLGLIIVPVSHSLRHQTRGGIVVVPVVDARFEPLEGATTNFPLHEGMRVYALRKRGSWVRIKTPDGRIGWVPTAAIGMISGK